VTGITIGQARGYAQWKGKRLPNALEWERAARGLDGGRYPWGDTEDPALANVRDNPMLTEHKSMPVRSYRRQQGIFNAAGNAAEFVDEASGPQVRGGSYETALGDIRPYEYKSVSETFLAPDVGFRCARNGK
jgi:formylglycine-generating enzyme required for sulfatase activity